MYEDQTYEEILQRMLDRIPDDIDRREGSVVYNALAPVALEFANMYAELDVNLNLRFKGSTGSDYLDLKVAEQGITRIAATGSQRQGLFYDSTGALLDIPVNSRFSIVDLYFVVTERLSIGRYRLLCETPGSNGNKPFGSLLPLSYIENLATAELSDVLVEGYEGESDESLLSRYNLKVQQQPVSSNKAHYTQLARQIPGIADVRVFRAWDGPGTVKVVLLSDDKRMPSSAVVNAAQSLILSEIQIGDGAVTVVGVTEVMVNISASLTLRAGGIMETAIEQIRESISSYLKDLAFSDTIIRYNKIGEAILSADDVLDHADLKVNGGTANLELQAEEVPVIGAVITN